MTYSHKYTNTPFTNATPSLESARNELRVLTRTSPLALVQVNEVFLALPDIQYTLIPIASFGDKHKEISLLENNQSDFFTRELDAALLRGDADIAIHSAKDLPYPLPSGLEIIALTKPLDKTDSLVSKENKNLQQLPPNAKIGTSSLLRKEELLQLRPDLQIVSIRGTIDERIAQTDNGTVDAVIVATCALQRLLLHHRIAEVLPWETHPLQGNLAIVAKKDNLLLKKIFSKIDIRKTYGKVNLVGFGPGDPELLTLKGFRLLLEAESIYYDDLLNEDFLHQFKAERIYVGKRCDNHSMEQEKINRLLLDAAIAGKKVIRLKGGDPMIFAHGGEEIEFLKQNYVEVDVVPGITSALAAAAISQIPLTHREITASVTFVSGHKIENVTFEGKGTIVIYMGASNASAIATKAITSGRKPATPVLLISNVSNPNQEKVFTDLYNLSESNNKLPTPMLMIIGDVVGLNSPAESKNVTPVIWVTGTNTETLKNHTIIHYPLIQISPLKDYSPLRTVFNKLSDFNWIIFTSRHTVHFFLEQLFLSGNDTRGLANNKIASVGKTTSQELGKYGIVPDMQAKLESSDGLLKEFKKDGITGKKILIPRSNLALSVLPEGLMDFGNNVTTLVVYENSKPEIISIPPPEDYDAVLFASPSCVENFVHLQQKFLPNKKYIVQGNQTFFKLISSGAKPSQVYTREDYETSMFYI